MMDIQLSYRLFHTVNEPLILTASQYHAHEYGGMHVNIIYVAFHMHLDQALGSKVDYYFQKDTLAPHIWQVASWLM